MRNEDVLLRVKEQRNILHEIRKRKANWIGHILRRMVCNPALYPGCASKKFWPGKRVSGLELCMISRITSRKEPAYHFKLDQKYFISWAR